MAMLSTKKHAMPIRKWPRWFWVMSILRPQKREPRKEHSRLAARIRLMLEAATPRESMKALM